jgi:hypothetical protein
VNTFYILQFIEILITLSIFFYLSYGICLFIKRYYHLTKSNSIKLYTHLHYCVQNKLSIYNYSSYHKYDIWRYYRISK